MISQEHYALAEAMASMDGYLDEFHNPDHQSGHFDSYIAAASEMIEQLRTRGFEIAPLDKP
jgi:hypothetical protein